MYFFFGTEFQRIYSVSKLKSKKTKLMIGEYLKQILSIRKP